MVGERCKSCQRPVARVRVHGPHQKSCYGPQSMKCKVETARIDGRRRGMREGVELAREHLREMDGSDADWDSVDAELERRCGDA